jgi:hypothetical protein
MASCPRDKLLKQLRVMKTQSLLVSTGWLVKVIVWDFPLHIWRLVKHIGIGLPITLWDLAIEVASASVAAITQHWTDVILHLRRALICALAWPIRFICKGLDLIGFGEFMDLLMQIFQWHTRPLTAVETAAAERVFGLHLNYSQIRVTPYSRVPKYIFRSWTAATVWHTVISPYSLAFADDPGTFIHELTHVWHMQQRGTQYMPEALYHGGFMGLGYYYGPTRDYLDDNNGLALAKARAMGRTIWDFNLEQQAEICSHYYMRLITGLSVNNYQPFIDDILSINPMPWRIWIRHP